MTGQNEGNRLGSEEEGCFSCQSFVYTVFTFSAAEVKFSMNRLRDKDKKLRRRKHGSTRKLKVKKKKKNTTSEVKTSRWSHRKEAGVRKGRVKKQPCIS